MPNMSDGEEERSVQDREENAPKKVPEHQHEHVEAGEEGKHAAGDIEEAKEERNYAGDIGGAKEEGKRAGDTEEATEEGKHAGDIIHEATTAEEAKHAGDMEEATEEGKQAGDIEEASTEEGKRVSNIDIPVGDIAAVLAKGVELEKWGKRKHIATASEIAVNAGEKANHVKDVMGYINKGAEGVKTAAVMNAEATEAGRGLEHMDMEEIVEAAEEAGKEAGFAAKIEGAEGGLGQMAEEAAADEIVQGHQYFECIEGTCLETPVRFVTEEIALPIYKFIGETCFSCCCTGDSAENLETTNQVGEATGEAAKGAGDAAGCVGKCFNSGICGFLDSASWCLVDEVLAYALPIIGTLFSCLRLYQGALLSFKGCLGRCRVRHGEKGEKLIFQWMAAEGHARLWQGCCGLIGAAPGLIIVTLPVIITCGVVAHKAKKRRNLIESGAEKKEIDGTVVVQSQPLLEAFPTPEARKKYFDHTYQVVSGKKAIDNEKDMEQELLELGFSDEKNPYPKAPHGQWSTGVCGCCEHYPSCFTACCCPCITIGQVAKTARLFKGVFYVTVAAFALDFAVGFGSILILVFGTYAIAKSRARIAKVYGIPVNTFGNWCCSFWCGCCVVAQVARHLYAWDRNNSGRCSGWLECGPNPTSRWPSTGGSNSSHSHQGGPVHEQSSEHGLHGTEEVEILFSGMNIHTEA
eukprot:g9366.t1